MSPLTIAILGATGTLGPFLLQALATHPKAPDVRIRILTRHKSIGKVHDITEKHKNLSITVFEIDCAAAAENTGLDTALDGVDVVLSAVGDDSGLTSKDVAHTGMLPGFKAQDAVALKGRQGGRCALVVRPLVSPTFRSAF
jgi:aspartate-semialdehyde dehydrogenase